MAVLPSQQRRSCESRVRRRLAECCAAGSEVGGMSCTDAVRRAGSAEPASIDPRAVEATSKPIMKRRSLAAHRNCCGAPRACGEVRGSSGDRSSGRCARSITEAERSAGAAAIDGSTVVRRKSIAQDSAGLRSDRLRHGVAAFLFFSKWPTRSAKCADEWGKETKCWSDGAIATCGISETDSNASDTDCGTLPELRNIA